MWTVQINNLNDEVANVTAINGNFSFSSTIKVGDLQNFVERTKKEFTIYQEENQGKETFRSELETLLNK